MAEKMHMKSSEHPPDTSRNRVASACGRYFPSGATWAYFADQLVNVTCGSCRRTPQYRNRQAGLINRKQ